VLGTTIHEFADTTPHFPAQTLVPERAAAPGTRGSSCQARG